MIFNLSHKDLVRLIRGCEPRMEDVEALQRIGCGTYVGGQNDHWEWAGEDSELWLNRSKEELWRLYTEIADSEDDNDGTFVYAVAYCDCEGEEVKAIFTEKEMAERYIDTKGDSSLRILDFELNPYFEEKENTWMVSMNASISYINAMVTRGDRPLVGYVRMNGEYLRTWVMAFNRTEAIGKANDAFLSVVRGREKGEFLFLDKEVYVPDRKFPNIKKRPFYDVASGKVVLGDFGALLLPKSEALLPDGTPNPDKVILLDRHFVGNYE